MSKNEIQKPPFYVAKVEPAMLPIKDKTQLILEVIKKSQMLEKDNMGRESVTIGVRHNDPIEVICLSDLHVGSLAAGLDPLIDLVEYILANPNVVVVDLGDSVEGIKAEYLDTNRTAIDLQQQIDLIRALVYEPLSAEGRILTMVSDYWGHPGWAQDATTMNPWISMTKGLNIPLIQNGGELNIRFANGHTVKQKIWHNPPSASNVDPVSGQRDEALTTSESSRANIYSSAHIHRTAVGEEEYAGGKMKVIYISSGTLKGSGGEAARDKYGVKLGKRGTDPMAQGVIIEPKTRGKEARSYPFATLSQGQTAFHALNLLNKLESQGMTQELLGRIRKEVETAPEIFYTQTKSRLGGIHKEARPMDEVKVGGETIKNLYSKMEMKTPYDRLSYDVRTKLPIALELVANARIGSSLDSETLKSLTEFSNKIKENPHALIVFLRNMIDKQAGDSPNRIKILDKFAGLVNGVQGQTLAIMMDESLRQSSWKRKKGDGPEGYPVAPGSYIATATTIPLIHHLSYMEITVGPSKVTTSKPRYYGAFVDKLNNSGSFSKPTFGLRQMYNKFTHEKPAFVAGGHMPSAGWMSFYDGTNAETHNPMLVGTGWWAKYVDTMGKGNVMTGAEPGQSIILMPGNSQADFMAFPTVNADETKYMHEALMLLKGLEIMEKDHPGITNKILKKK